MAAILSHAKTNNVSLKLVYENIWSDILNSQSSDFTTFKFLGNYEKVKNKIYSYNDFKGTWKYIMGLIQNKNKMARHSALFDWNSDRVGSLYIKALKLIGEKKKCKNQKNEVLRLIQETFKLPQTEKAYLPEIAQLYSSMDFIVLTKNSSYLADVQENFVNCFKHVQASKKLSNTKKKVLFDNEDEGIFVEKSICHDKIVDLECEDYCKWHHDVIKNMDKKQFLEIMKYSMPQRKLFLDQDDVEYEMAKEVFGEENTWSIPNKVAPESPIIFCYNKGVGGYTGDDFGEHAKVCADFFPTPTDIGMALTKNFDIKKVLKAEDAQMNLLEPDSNDHNPIWKIDGTSRSKLTLIIDTNSLTILKQNSNKKLDGDLKTIQLQIHQNKELANMILENNQDDFSEPVTLSRGYEYTYEVYPHGQISSEEFKAVGKEKRNCKLDDEVDQTGIFKIYSYKNCKYSCHVELASKQCGCRPWDFFGKSQMGECDVFGRTCFLNAMELISMSDESLCTHCQHSCDFMKFKKIQKSRYDLGHGYSGKYFYINKTTGQMIDGSKALFEFLLDKNQTIIDQGLRNVFDAFKSDGTSRFNKYFPSLNYDEMIVVHLQFMQPEVNIISPKYTVFDMIGNFGGQFGLFEQVTGASFLGLINLLVLTIKFLSPFKRN